MHNSDLITPQHLTRKAVIYIRQSTPHQVLSHQESLRLQYALGERARQLGWPDAAIDIIEDDLGLTAASAAHREGFNALVAQVTLEQVGLILSYDVTRLSRNCSDWYPLLDLCGYKGCLIADSDGIYDPATVNGRLLLGLKGTLSEWERHTMKARLNAGLIHKAERTPAVAAPPRSLWRSGLEGAPGGGRTRDSQASGLCRGVHLWSYSHTATRGQPGTPRHHSSTPGAVARLHPGRLPALHQLGDISPDSDDAHRQSRGV